jgi:uncharacterized protein (TIRG00374 family)
MSAAALLWVYWGFDWRAELPKLRAADWRWLAFAMLADVLTYFLQAWRWQVLLRPVARCGFWRSAQAIFVGLFANSVLPLRSGELVRTYLQALWSELPFAVTLSSVLIERLLDGVILVAAFYGVAGLVTVPRYLLDGALVLALVVGILLFILAAAVFHKQHAHAAARRSRWAEGLRHVVEGLHAMGRAPSFWWAGVLSALYLAAQLMPVWAVARCLNLAVPVLELAVVLVVVRVGTVLPQAPSNVGGFQFFTVVGLGLFGVDKATAAGFATVLFLAVTIPLWVAGAAASALAGVGIRELHEHAARLGRGSGRAAPLEPPPRV